MPSICELFVYFLNVLYDESKISKTKKKKILEFFFPVLKRHVEKTFYTHTQ